MAPNQDLKSCKPHENSKKKQKNQIASSIGEQLKTKGLLFFVSIF